MAVYWGTTYGYIKSPTPSLIGVFSADKRPTARPAVDDLGNEVTSIGPLPTHPEATFHIAENEKEALYEAKLAMLSATETKILQLTYAMADLKLTTETAQFKLKNKFIDEGSRGHLTNLVESNKATIALFEEQLADVKKLRRAKIPTKNLRAYEAT